jgi:hypothetical protein
MTSYDPPRHLLGALLIAFGVSFIPLAAAQRIPDKADLKSRVRQFYKAYQTRDQRALLSLVLPQILRCTPIEDKNLFNIWDSEGPHRVIAWKIVGIEYDMHNFQEAVELCQGEVVRASSGAVVTISQTDQEREELPETGEMYLPWLYVEGTWYFLVDCP